MAAPGQPVVRLHGFRELNRAFDRADKTLKADWRNQRRAIGEPVRQMSQSRALSEVRNMPASPAWGRMRTGVTTRVVYVAPVKRGIKGRGNDRGRRPNLADLMMDRAMQPALQANEHRIVHDVEQLLDRMGRSWAAGG